MSAMLTRRRFALAGASAALAGCTSWPELPEASGPPPSALQARIAAAREGHELPAMAVYVGRNGEMLDAACVGVRALGYAEPATINDRWHIGSCAKAMTATLLARYVERGVCAFDSPLSALLPDLAGEMHAEMGAVTLAQLLSMRAGLPENPVYDADEMSREGLAQLEAIAAAAPTPGGQRTVAAQRALSRAPLTPPGSTFAYSNTGYIIAGAIADRLSGATYEDALARDVLSPLGISDYGWGPPGQPNTRDQPQGHGDPYGGDVYRSVAPNEAWADNPPYYASAGGMNITLADWAKFAFEHGRGDLGHGQLLSGETYARLHTPAGEGSVYAMGWGAGVREDGTRWIITHNGSNGLWFADIRVYPPTGAVFLMATNDGREDVCTAAFREVRAYLNETYAPGTAEG